MGRHFCAGAQLARLEMNIALHALLDYAGEISIAEGKVPEEVGIFARYADKVVLVLRK